MNILAVGAHPDDLESLCGGTLVLYAKQGHKVFMCHAVNGNLGHETIPRDELSEIRREEAINAAKVIGAESFTLDIDDMGIYDGHETRMKMVEVIRKADPDVILTHAPNDYMPDHFNTSKLVFNSSFMSTLPLVETETPRNRKVSPLYYMDNVMGVDFQPNEYVDITDVIKIKEEMFRCHKSQLEWLKEHHNIEVIEYMYTVARFRGLQCDRKYAEGFKRVNMWGRITPERLLPLN